SILFILSKPLLLPLPLPFPSRRPRIDLLLASDPSQPPMRRRPICPAAAVLLVVAAVVTIASTGCKAPAASTADVATGQMVQALAELLEGELAALALAEYAHEGHRAEPGLRADDVGEGDPVQCEQVPQLAGANEHLPIVQPRRHEARRPPALRERHHHPAGER